MRSVIMLYGFCSGSMRWKPMSWSIVAYKVDVGYFLDVLAVWYRDVLLYKATKNPGQLVFADQLKYIKKKAEKSSYEGIEIIVQSLEKAKVRLKANVNFELTMELLLLTIKEN